MENCRKSKRRDGGERQAFFRRGRVGASRGDNLVFDDVETDESRSVLGLEVAAHGILQHGLQFLEGVSLREY